MSDSTPEAAPSAAPAAVPVSTPPAAPSRRRLALIIGGAVIIVLVVVAVVLVVAFGGNRGPAQAVNDLIRSIETGDCTLYVASTTESFRGNTISADDCEKSDAFGSGTIDYTLAISKTDVSGSTATVEGTLTIADTSDPTTEPVVTPITFNVVQEGGAWKVDSSQ